MSHYYIELLPNEYAIVKDLMKKFFVESHFKLAVDHVDKYIFSAVNFKFNDPFSKIVAVFKDKPSYPLIDPKELLNVQSFDHITVKSENVPIGYIWYKTNQHEALPQMITEVNHIYVEPEYRGGMVIKKLIDRVILQSQRTGSTITGVDARTVEAKELWQKLGFKTESVRLTHMGGAEQFMIDNEKYFKASKMTDEELVDDSGIDSTKTKKTSSRSKKKNTGKEKLNGRQNQVKTEDRAVT